MESIYDTWFSCNLEENHISRDVWENAIDFEKIWLKHYETDPDWWNVTGWGTIVCDIETEDGIISIEIGKTQIGFYTDFKEGLENWTIDGFDWPVHEELMSEILKMLLKKYENNQKSKSCGRTGKRM